MKLVSLSLHHQLKNIIPEFKAKFNTNMAILIWILVISFSIDCQIDIYENTDQDLPNNILERFNLFNAIYKDNFWGEKTVCIKQKALKEKIYSLVKDQTSLKSFLNKAFVVSPESQKTVLNSLALRVPVYYGNIIFNSFAQASFKEFRTLLYPNYEYRDEITTFNKSHIVFPAGVTPYWSWDKDKEELTKQGEIGIVFSNGVNFESKKTADYNNFNGKDKEEELKKFIENIALCLVTAAYKLTKDQNKKTCQLKIPAFGLTVFSNCYCKGEEEAKKKLARLYVEAIYEALKKKEFDDLTWYVEFFRYKNSITTGYVDACQKIIQEQKDIKEQYNYINITYCSLISLFNKDECNFNENYMEEKEAQDNYFTVFAHAGDAHSFLGNGGYSDGSLEQVLIGLNNDHYLNAIHLLNLFLPEIVFSKSQQETLTNLCNKENEKQEEVQAIQNKKQEEEIAVQNENENLEEKLQNIPKKFLTIERVLIIVGWIVAIGIITYLVKKFIIDDGKKMIDIDQSSKIKNAYKL